MGDSFRGPLSLYSKKKKFDQKYLRHLTIKFEPKKEVNVSVATQKMILWASSDFTNAMSSGKLHLASKFLYQHLTGCPQREDREMERVERAEDREKWRELERWGWKKRNMREREREREREIKCHRSKTLVECHIDDPVRPQITHCSGTNLLQTLERAH